MELMEALGLVSELAEQNVLSEFQAEGSPELEDEKTKQELAIEIVDGLLTRFIEDVYELAFGDDAINKGYDDKQVKEKLREFSDNALQYENKYIADIYAVFYGGENVSDTLYNKQEAIDCFLAHADEGKGGLSIRKVVSFEVYENTLSPLDYETCGLFIEQKRSGTTVTITGKHA